MTTLEEFLARPACRSFEIAPLDINLARMQMELGRGLAATADAKHFFTPIELSYTSDSPVMQVGAVQLLCRPVVGAIWRRELVLTVWDKPRRRPSVYLLTTTNSTREMQCYVDSKAFFAACKGRVLWVDGLLEQQAGATYRVMVYDWYRSLTYWLLMTPSYERAAHYMDALRQQYNRPQNDHYMRYTYWLETDDTECPREYRAGEHTDVGLWADCRHCARRLREFIHGLPLLPITQLAAEEPLRKVRVAETEGSADYRRLYFDVAFRYPYTEAFPGGIVEIYAVADFEGGGLRMMMEFFRNTDDMVRWSDSDHVVVACYKLFHDLADEYHVRRLEHLW